MSLATRGSSDAVDVLRIIDTIASSMAREAERGRVASYIPELAKADAARFGMAVAVPDGKILVAGDADVAFSIQSVSKVFTLALALDRVGERLWERVGREPSGDPFNSIVQLEHERGIPRNPLINAGAIVVADAILGERSPAVAVEDILGLMRDLAGDHGITCDPAVAASESRTGARNRALANFMLAEGNLHRDPEEVLAVYFHHCAISMTCRQLAAAGRVLMSDGRPAAGVGRLVPAHRARRLTALMLTCGQYDASGEFAYRVGIPSKSGVGGGILGVVPGVASIATWSPGLDAKGNSLLGGRAFEALARATGWSVFGPI